MKRLIFFAAAIIPMAISSQVISGEIINEYIVQENNDTLYVEITKVKKNKIEIVDPRSSDNLTIWLDRSLLKDFYYVSGEKINWLRDDNGNIRYQDVVEVEGVSKGDLYTAARTAMADIYRESDEVLELDDRIGGVMVGRGWATINNTQVWHTTKLEFKDGRYRITVDNVRTRIAPSQYYSGYEGAVDRYCQTKSAGWCNEYKTRVLRHLQNHFDIIKAAIISKTKESDSW